MERDEAGNGGVVRRLPSFKQIHHFAEGESPDPPFITYLLPGSDNFPADGKVYFRITEVHIELYTDAKDPPLEQKVEKLLTEHEMFFHKSEVWIEEEKMYEVLYEVVLDLQYEDEDGSEEPESEENP